MKATVLSRPLHSSGVAPALASVAPTMPPMRACELLDGMLYHQVITLQLMAPIRAAKITY